MTAVAADEPVVTVRQIGLVHQMSLCPPDRQPATRNHLPPPEPARHLRRRTGFWQHGIVTDPPAGTVSVTLDEDGGIGMSVSPTDRPVDLLRAAAAVLERCAANLEREQAPVHCGVCGQQPTGVRALPSGPWRFEPCGHGVPMSDAASP